MILLHIIVGLIILLHLIAETNKKRKKKNSYKFNTIKGERMSEGRRKQNVQSKKNA